MPVPDRARARRAGRRRRVVAARRARGPATSLFLVFLPPLLTAAGFYSIAARAAAEAGPARVPRHRPRADHDGRRRRGRPRRRRRLSWPAAFVLGAVVAPTDPVAAAATFSRLGVPERVGILVEGEALVNDATALVAFRDRARRAATSARSAPARRRWSSSARVIGGVAIGLDHGLGARRCLRRLEDQALSILLTLLFPYAAYVAAEAAHGVRRARRRASAGCTSAGSRTTPFATPTRA